MKNFLQQGRTCTFVAPYALLAGAIFAVGSLVAIANTDAAQGAEVEGDLEGVFSLPKAAVGAGTDAVAGTKVYFDTVLKTVTKTAGANTVLIGATIRDATAADTHYRVRLNGTTV